MNVWSKAATIAAVLLLTGCATAQATPRSAPIADAIPIPVAVHDGPVRVAVVGDSLTTWSPPWKADPAQSWVNTAMTGQVVLDGGWAHSGSTTAMMLEHVAPSDAEVVVIVAGINDIIIGVPAETRLANIEAIVAKIGTPNVELSATAPYDPNPAVATEWNQTLQQFATAKGWSFVDPWVSLRNPDGTWVDGMTWEGVHPVPAAATILGDFFHTYLWSKYW